MKQMLFLFSMAILLGSCANTKEATADINGSSGSSSSNQGTIFQDVSQGDSLFASIKRGFCFGRCPVFEMRIYNNGTVHYFGQANVDLKDWQTTHISEKQMAAFITLALEINYMEMKDDYDNPHVTDLPAMTTSIVINKERKTVRRRVDFPPSLKKFEELFDALLTSEKWSPSSNPLWEKEQ